MSSKKHIFDQEKFGLLTCPHGDREDIILDAVMARMLVKELVGSLLQIPEFLFGNAFLGVPKLVIAPCFYFYKMQFVTFGGNDINFIMRITPVLIQDGIRFLHQVGCGKRFLVAKGAYFSRGDEPNLLCLLGGAYKRSGLYTS